MPEEDPAGLDLAGVLVGSEGTLAVVTKVWVRLTPNPQDYRTMRATFDSLDDAGSAVSQIIAAGILPAAMELMDQGILAAVEEAYHFGFSPDAAAVLVIEIDGPTIGLDRQQERIVELCTRFGARRCCRPPRPSERAALWKCRKMAVGATGRLEPELQDRRWRGAAHAVARNHAPHRRNRPKPRYSHRQRRPRRRRQHPSDPAVRRARSRASRARRGGRP